MDPIEISRNGEKARNNEREADISLPALEDEHRVVLDELATLQSSVIRSEAEVSGTEVQKTKANEELTASNRLLDQKNVGIKKKDDGIAEKRGEISINEGTIAKNAKRIEILKGQKTSTPTTAESPESLEAVNGPGNQTTNSAPSSSE